MAARRGEKEPLDAVQLNQLQTERVRKELKSQRLHTEFSVNPLHPVHTLAKKPMSWHDNIEEKGDEKFLNLIHHAALEPTKKYSEPQTESQEIGWNAPLIHVDRTDRRLHFPAGKLISLNKWLPWGGAA